MSLKPRLSKSQHQVALSLKSRGAQSIRILAKHLKMTAMGARKHLTILEHDGIVKTSKPTHQTRGRPVILWALTGPGHALFHDDHSSLAIDMLSDLEEQYPDVLEKLMQLRLKRMEAECQAELVESKHDLEKKVNALASLRTDQGYMAEVRLLPKGWLLIENHCPIYAATLNNPEFAEMDLELFKNLFAGQASVTQVDHLLGGDRRTAFKIEPL
jgi:predicted ArsR family transcriptional regulator